MPPVGEKQPAWLMGCKCGTRVKARLLTQIYRFFKAIGAFFPQNHGTWTSGTAGDSPFESESTDKARLALHTDAPGASAGWRDGRLSEKLGKIDHGGQEVTLTFEQHLPFQLGRAE